ncbi:MAG: biotin--[acetyl-CoA-carboxylase] ligase [Bacteroidetes bacterium]|nr:biotin--[acetyl-CoA-carboxylase] ligase [Bacteroidota bacterium]
MLNTELILSALNSRTFGRTVYSFESIDSTNTFARGLDRNSAPHGTVVIADEQTSGRGRLQREWISTKGMNLLLSVILYPEFNIEKTALLPLIGSLAVSDAVDALTGLTTSCKWPNDVLIGHKKFCGMLLESASGSSGIEKIILGIGINVNQSEFPEGLLHKATSLRNECGKEIDRVSLLTAVLEELENRYEQLAHFPSAQLLNDWKLKALLFGKKITVLESEFSYSAVAVDIAEDGGLIIQTEDGEKKKILAGDVSLAYQ